MDAPLPLKQQLPFPYNQDMSKVLRRLNRRTPFSRERLANDPVTAAYIAAAMRLVERHLGPSAKRTPVDPDDDNSFTRPLLAFLSQRAVTAEVANNPTPFPCRANVSTMRSTWRSHSDFIADLLSFGLWSQHYPMQNDNEVATGAEQLIEGPDFVHAVHALSFWDSTTLINMPTFRLALVAAAGAEGDEVILQAGRENYLGIMEPWKQVYAALLQARRLKLRPGVTLDDLANLLTAVSEGATLRALSDPQAEIIDQEQRRSLLGKAALAVILGCLERVEDAQGLTLEQAVHAMVYDRQPAAKYPR